MTEHIITFRGQSLDIGRYCSGDTLLPQLCAPFRCTWNGHDHIAATDGHIAVLVIPDNTAQLPPADDKAPKLAVAITLSPPESIVTKTVEMAALKKYLEPAQWPADGPCPTCQATGRMECCCCGGTRTVIYECPECGREITADCHCEDGKTKCTNCDGEKHAILLPDKRHGRIFGIGVNRNFMAQALEPFDDLEVRISYFPGTHKVIHFAAPDGRWLAGVLPIANHDFAWPEFPEHLQLHLLRQHQLR